MNSEPQPEKEPGSQCPSPEVRSQYFDGALEPDAPEAAHIKTCPHCQQEIEKLTACSTAWRDKIHAGTVEFSTETLKTDVYRKIADDATRRARLNGYQKIFWPVAAIVTWLLLAWNYSMLMRWAEATPPVPVECGTLAFLPLENFSAADVPVAIPAVVSQCYRVEEPEAAVTWWRTAFARLGLEPEVTTDGGKTSFKVRLTTFDMLALLREFNARDGVKVVNCTEPLAQRRVILGRPDDVVTLELGLQ